MQNTRLAAPAGVLFGFVVIALFASFVSGPLVGLIIVCMSVPMLIAAQLGAFQYLTHSGLSAVYVLTLIITSVAPSLGLLGTVLRFAAAAVIVAVLILRPAPLHIRLPRHVASGIILLVCLLLAAMLGAPSIFYGLSRLINWLMFLPLFFLYYRFPISGALIFGFIWSGILQMLAIALQAAGILGGTWGGLIVSGDGYDPVNSTWLKRYTGFLLDPNNLGLWLCVSALAALYMLVREKRTIISILFFSLFLLFGYGILLTGSRGSLVALAAGVLVFCFLIGRKGLAIVLAFGCVASVLATLSVSEEVDRIVLSFAEILSGSDTSATARLDLWSNYIASNNNWIMGAGFGSYAAEAVSAQSGLFVSAEAAGSATIDNGWLKLLLESGIVGLCSYLLVYVSCGIAAIRNRTATRGGYFSSFVAASLVACFWRSLSIDILDLNPWNAAFFLLFAASLAPSESSSAGKALLPPGSDQSSLLEARAKVVRPRSALRL